MFQNKGIAYKLSVSILSIVFLIFAVIFIYNYVFSRKLILKNVQENTKNLTSSAVNKSEGFFNSIEKIARNFRFVLENSIHSDEDLHNLMQEILKNNEEIYGSCVAFEPNEFHSDLKLYAPYYYKDSLTITGLGYEDLGKEDYMYPEWDWYQIPKMLDKPVWSEPYFDEGGGEELMTTFSVPFYKYEGDKKIFRGIITVDVSLNWLQEVVSAIKIFETGYAFLISQRGTFITHKNKDYIMNESIYSLAEYFNYPELREIGKEMTSGKEDFVPIKAILYEGNSWIHYSSLDNNNWSLGFIFPENELYADLTSLNNMLIMLAVLGFGILLGLIVLIANRITKPLHQLSLIAQDIGSGNFEQEIPETKENDEVGILNSSFRSMQNALKEYITNLQSTTAAKEKIESELKIAREIQMGIVPREFPAFPNRKEIDLFGYIEPAKDVGGDLYDFFFIDDKRLCFCVGDVSGKGTPAALFMAITATIFRAKAQLKDISADKIVELMNAFLCNNNERGLFVTFFLGILNIETGELEYCNAGHNFPVIIREDGSIQELDKTHHLPLGVFELPSEPSDKMIMGLKDKIFIFTDGINEAMNINSEQYSDETMLNFLKTTSLCNPIETVNKMIEDVKRFTTGAEQSDDMTVLVVEYLGNYSGNGSSK